MANDQQPVAEQPSTQSPLGASVQAHLGKASHFADGLTRNWSLFFFFRILPEAELAMDYERLAKLMAATKADDREAMEAAARELLAAIHHPAAMNAGVVKQAWADGQAAPDAPAQPFLDWLKVLTGPSYEPLGRTLRSRMATAGVPMSFFEATTATPATDSPAGARAHEPAATAGFVDVSKAFETMAFTALAGDADASQIAEKLWASLREMPAILSDTAKFNDYMASFGSTAGESGLRALSGGLATVCLYEMFRQLAPARSQPGLDKPWPALRSEAIEKMALPSFRDASAQKPWDPVAINIAFTFSGLKALKLDEAALASFPDAFRQGMAARAQQLGDTGPSAPEHWEGVLGLDCVHGYFTGGYLVGSKDKGGDEAWWQRLRDEVRAFNDQAGDQGSKLRMLFGLLFRLLGIEILQIEIGVDPYEVDLQGMAKRLDYRREHFGFRDGLSQPFVDLGLGDPPPGGGTPRRNRTWSPVAPGEIYLDREDEDGNCHKFPANELLRRGSTFAVFRKLEQDVVGFRTFLAKQRPDDAGAQRRLAAEFVGRWQNGTSLVTAPNVPLELGRNQEELLNDFLYAADDPLGSKCPLSAHVRRTNPRDIGGTNDVRRHRILRRAIAYGGPLLPENVLGDGNKRGLLFIAVNSRIDLQFEVIQSNWINKGELLGQAGLNRCPLTGANSGTAGDAFLEAGAAAPVTGVPRFVVTRGGDYFFAPGVEPLKALADGCKFKVDRSALPFQGYSMGDTETPTLFDADRIAEYGARILAGNPSVIRVALPPVNAVGTSMPSAAPVAFVGQLKDVQQVLRMRLAAPVPDASQTIVNSVAQYRSSIERLSFGRHMLVATEAGSATAKTRDRMQDILNTAWSKLDDVYPRLARITKRSIEDTLQATGKSRRIDLVHDLASTAVYDVLDQLFGTPGPDWLTELAVALPFSHRHFGELQPDWLMAARAGTPDNVGLTTMQIWSILMFVDIIGNYQDQPELMALSQQAASELTIHLESLLATARARHAPPSTNMVAAFVSLEKYFTSKYRYSSMDYYIDVRMLLLEMIGTTMTNIPATMGAVMDAVLTYRIPLPDLIPVLLRPPMFPPTPGPEDGVGRLVYETCRLNGMVKLLMRTCMQNDTLPSGGKVRAGDWVAALVAVASVDPRGFGEPFRFSLRPFLPGPPRDIDKYLLFGAKSSSNPQESRDCWGRDRLALFMVKECVKAAGRLARLQRVAGPEGAPRSFMRITIGLSARFANVLPDWS
jgi:deferrochelatase/peroxidase EfeB/cytochrome P450